MEFCPSCGTRIILTKKKRGNTTLFVLSCPKCSFEEKARTTTEVAPKVIEHSPQEHIAIIGKQEQKLRTMPTVTIECPKCRNNLAYVWQVQTRGSDESSTQFFRCTKCKFTFREYS